MHLGESLAFHTSFDLFPLILLQGMKLANYMLGLDVYLINTVLLEHQHFQDKAWKWFLLLLLMPSQPKVSFLFTRSHVTISMTFELKGSLL